MSKADRLSDALDEFLAVSPDVEAAAIVSADGLPIASALPVDVQEDRLAAMSAALLTLGEKAAEGLGKGDLAQVFVEGENGYVVLMAAGQHAVLVCVTSKQAKVGLVLYEMRKASADIAGVMDQPASAFEDPLPAEPASVPADAMESVPQPQPAPVDAYIPAAVAGPPSAPSHEEPEHVSSWQ